MSPDRCANQTSVVQANAPLRVLIVDDEPIVRLLLSRLMRREVPCDVTEAVDGAEALDLLQHRRFDVVVLDVVMPFMDGIETLAAIRTSPALAGLPVIVLSAVRDEPQVRRLVSLGISAYLTKPLRPPEASARIRRFLSTLAPHPMARGGAEGPPAPVEAPGADADSAAVRLRASAVPGDGGRRP